MSSIENHPHLTHEIIMKHFAVLFTVASLLLAGAAFCQEEAEQKPRKRNASRNSGVTIQLPTTEEIKVQTTVSVPDGGTIPLVAIKKLPKTPTFKKLVLSDKFHAEGAYYGDFNKDGKLDVVAGPYWYEGPDFTVKHEIYDTKSFDPENYSDNFGMFTADLNGDGWDDVFICPHPGTTSYWYENPKGAEGHWRKHMGPEQLGNESQMWADILRAKGFVAEEHFRESHLHGPLYNVNGFLGFATYRIKDNLPEWTFHKVSGEDKRYQRYTHGIGYGDINGDGVPDVLEAKGWWEQRPEMHPSGMPNRPASWTFHPFDFGPAPSHMLVYDFNGDGLNDVVCAWHCHLYGLVYWKQVKDAEGKISFEKQEILPVEPDMNSDALRITQMHAFDLADFNGDGVMDFVTGKRFWAHGSKGDKEADAPAVLYWFETKRDDKGGVEFIPHLIDDDSGVGTQVTAVDLNGDGTPDVIVSNKKGTFVFLSE